MTTQFKPRPYIPVASRPTCTGCVFLPKTDRPKCTSEASPHWRTPRETYHDRCRAFATAKPEPEPAAPVSLHPIMDEVEALYARNRHRRSNQA